MEESGATPSAIEKAKNGRDIFTDKIADEIVLACGSGFTLEKAGALVGVNPSTIRTWAQRKPDFGKRVETARKKHELSLLRDIQLAGEKSWQAKAWLAERIYNHGVPSARLQVSQDVTHGISGNLAQLLAGIRGRKQEKKAEVIDMPALTKPQTQLHSIPMTSADMSQKIYCINKSPLSDNNLQKTPTNFPKVRHKRMRQRKPRAESLAKYPPTTTPPLPPPAAV
jgi:hypothetical protein